MRLGSITLEVTLTAVDGRAEVLLSGFQLPRFEADDAEVIVGIGVLGIEFESA